MATSGTALLVELVQVLADAVPVGPRRSTGRGPRSRSSCGRRMPCGHRRDPEHVARRSSCTRPSLSVARTWVTRVRHAVVGELARARPTRGCSTCSPSRPHPTAVQVAGSVPMRMPPKWVSSPMLIENQRHIFGPPQRRGPHDLSRLPRASDELVRVRRRPRSNPSSARPARGGPCRRTARGRRARALALAALAVGADRRRERVEREVHRARSVAASRRRARSTPSRRRRP